MRQEVEAVIRHRSGSFDPLFCKTKFFRHKIKSVGKGRGEESGQESDDDRYPKKVLYGQASSLCRERKIFTNAKVINASAMPMTI